MEELDIGNILSPEEVEDLFSNESTDESESTEQTEDNKEEKKETTEVDPETLFEKPESVGSEENNQEKEDAPANKAEVSSPKTSFYSSIAKALKEEGIFPDLDDSIYNKCNTPEAFRDLVEQQIQAGLNERQKRIEKALNAGIEPSEINKYEATINYIDSITDDKLKDEGDEGENLRKQLIFQDFINRGYSKERAQREVKKSFDAGTDIEDAQEALAGNREFFTSQYNTLVQKAEDEEKKVVDERNGRMEQLKKSILEDSKFFGDVEVDKSTRQKVYDSICKPTYKDPNTGNYLTALQKYESENKVDFLKNLGLLYTLTNGFKDINTLVKGKAKREVKKSLRELENTLSNTVNTSDGNLKFISGVSEDPESYFDQGWSVDV